MDKAIITLFASVQARFTDVAFLNGWATKMKRKLPMCNSWLDSLEVCQSLDCAENAIREELISSGIDVGMIFPRLLVGFLYLRLTMGKLTMLDFENEIIDIADAYDIVGLEIDRVKVALHRLEADLEFLQLLDGMAQESLDQLRQVEALID